MTAYALRADALDLTDACAVVATVGTTSSTAVDPVAAIADRAAAAGTWLHVDAAYAGAAAVCPELRHHFAGWERADSIGVQPAQVAVHPDGLLGVLLPASRRPAARVQPRARVPAGERGRRQPERVRLTARPPLPGAEAVGDAALLRPRGAAGDHPRARAAGGAVRAVGRGRAGLGALRSASLLARLLPLDRQRRGERRDHGARQRQRPDLPLAHEARRPLRAAARDRQCTHERGGRRACMGRAARGSRARSQARRSAPRPAGSGRAPG